MKPTFTNISAFYGELTGPSIRAPNSSVSTLARDRSTLTKTRETEIWDKRAYSPPSPSLSCLLPLESARVLNRPSHHRACVFRAGCWIVSDDGGRGATLSFLSFYYYNTRLLIKYRHCPPFRIPKSWGTKEAWKERASRGNRAPLLLQRGLRVLFQHRRALDSSSSPAMVRQSVAPVADPAWGLTGTPWAVLCSSVNINCILSSASSTDRFIQTFYSLLAIRSLLNGCIYAKRETVGILFIYVESLIASH